MFKWRIVGPISVLLLLFVYLAATGSGQAQSANSSSKVYLPQVVEQPTMTPTVTPTPVPSFSDNFSNPNSGWPVTDDQYATRQYNQGQYQIVVKQPGYLITAGHGLSGGDFEMSVDANSASDPSAIGAYGFYFGSTTSGFYVFGVATDGGFFLQSYSAASQSFATLIPWTGSSAIHTGNQANHIKVARQGTLILLFCNGTQLAQVNDATHGVGSAGLAAFSGDTSFDARFSNFYFTPTAIAPISPNRASAESLPSEPPSFLKRGADGLP